MRTRQAIWSVLAGAALLASGCGGRTGSSTQGSIAPIHKDAAAHAIKLFKDPAAARSLAQPRRALDVRVALPDVALGGLTRDLVPARGFREPEPVPERPLLPHAVSRDGACEADSHCLPLPLHRREVRDGDAEVQGEARRG